MRGNPGKRPIDPQPKPRGESPVCPDHLTEEGKAEWSRITVELGAMGLLFAADRAALAAYCQCWARWVKAENELAATSEVPRKQKGKMSRPNPWLAVANDALRNMRAFLVEFGLTPSSRCRVPAGPAADPLDRFLGKKSG